MKEQRKPKNSSSTPSSTPEGVADFSPVEIPAEDREHLITELGVTKVSPDSIDKFFKELGIAAGMYRSGRELSSKSTPSKTTHNLDLLLDDILNLYLAFENLDTNSQKQIRAINKGGAREILQSHLLPMMSVVSEAASRSAKPSKKGRLPEPHRLLLAIDIANAMKNHLGITPRSTMGGSFQFVLSTILEIASEQEVKSVHDLARKAIRELKYRKE